MPADQTYTVDETLRAMRFLRDRLLDERIPLDAALLAYAPGIRAQVQQALSGAVVALDGARRVLEG